MGEANAAPTISRASDERAAEACSVSLSASPHSEQHEQTLPVPTHPVVPAPSWRRDCAIFRWFKRPKTEPREKPEQRHEAALTCVCTSSVEEEFENKDFQKNSANRGVAGSSRRPTWKQPGNEEGEEKALTLYERDRSSFFSDSVSARAEPLVDVLYFPGTRIAIPRSIILFMYILSAFLTGSTYFGWPAFSHLLFKSGAFSWECPVDEDGVVIKALPSPTGNGSAKPFICDQQDAAVAPLFTVAQVSECFMCIFSGVLLDNLSPMVVSLLGQLLNSTGWILLACSSKNFRAYIPAMICIGCGTETTYLPLLRVASLFPGRRATVITVIGAANSAAFAIPLILVKIWEAAGPAWSFGDICAFYLCIGPLFCAVITICFIPYKGFTWDVDEQEDGKAQKDEMKRPVHARGSFDSGVFSHSPSGSILEKLKIQQKVSVGGSVPTTGETPAVVLSSLASDSPSPSSSFLVSVASPFQEGSPDPHGLPAFSRLVTHDCRRCSAFEVGDARQEDAAVDCVREIQHKGRGQASTPVPEASPEDKASCEDDEVQGPPSPHLQDATRLVDRAGRRGRPDETQACGKRVSTEQEVQTLRSLSNLSRQSSRSLGQRPDSVCSEVYRERSASLVQHMLATRGAEAGRCSFASSFNMRSRHLATSRLSCPFTAPKPSFLEQLFSKYFLCICVYTCTTAVATAFLQSAASRVYREDVLEVAEIAFCFTFVPCVIMGWIIDNVGSFPAFVLTNTMAIVALVCATLSNSATVQYISVAAFCIHISVDNEQIFCYVQSMFRPEHFGKLSGLFIASDGLFALIAIPLYDDITVRLLGGNAMPVALGLTVVLVLVYIPIVALWVVKRKHSNPYGVHEQCGAMEQPCAEAGKRCDLADSRRLSEALFQDKS
ncbi:putative transmembrane protein [Toxoplasma gondii VAND]|uniref:Putative transmembrane protein n=1 Tax=Toxoplasma gondii VAND TaxID=933077 RepID=A0A086QCE6_TOXGO|nr:putative transmembrane protein [Toxoplasma gondii VAND]